MKINIGNSASNSKSTELNIRQMVFPNYTAKLDKRTFNEGFEKRHKELELIRNPIRLAYIGEFDQKLIDTEILKYFVDGKDFTVKILYGTKEVNAIQCKLMKASKKDPNMEEDEGVTRKMRVQHYESRFVNGVEDDFKANVFGRVENYEYRFSLATYENAYFHLLLKHVDNPTIPAAARLAFKTISADYDEFTNLLDERYDSAKNPDDRVSKYDLESYFLEYRYKWPVGVERLEENMVDLCERCAI